jgi:hypothetical protein
MNRQPSHEWLDKQISPVRIVLAYAVFAALWIVLSGVFLTFSVNKNGNPPALPGDSKGLTE